uniref:CRIM domain-containing protein n=1 Tax=Parastrongyloides trichosuri TaxID=131310 RepID=A0A0N4ZFM0_PARTI
MTFHNAEEINDFISHVMNLEDKIKPWSNQILKTKVKKKVISSMTVNSDDTTSSDTSFDEDETIDSNDDVFNAFENKLGEKLSSSKLFKEKNNKVDDEKLIEEKNDNDRIFEEESNCNSIEIPKTNCESPISSSGQCTSFISMFLENLQLNEHEDSPNPYEEYCKYINNGPNHISIKITLPFIESGNEILVVECLRDIEISNLIGLICYIYTLKNYQPPLKEVYFYELKIAHSTVDIDYDLPSLDTTKKFNDTSFEMLALVDITTLNEGFSKTVTVYTYDAKPFYIELPSHNVPLKMVRDKCLEMAKSKLGLNNKLEGIDLSEIEYVLQKLDDPYLSLDLKMSLIHANCDEFVLLRQNSVRGDFSNVYEKRIIKSSTYNNDANNSGRKSSSSVDNSLPAISEYPPNIQDIEVCSIAEEVYDESKFISTFQVERITHLLLKKSEILEIRQSHIQFSSIKTSKVSLIIPWELLAHFVLLKSHGGVSTFQIAWLKFDSIITDNNVKNNTLVTDSKNFFQRFYRRRNSFNYGSLPIMQQSSPTTSQFILHYNPQFFDDNISTARWKYVTFDIPEIHIRSLEDIMISVGNNLSAFVYLQSEDGRVSPVEAWKSYKNEQLSAKILNNFHI